MLREGDVEQYVIVPNRNVVRVKIKKEAIAKYEAKLGKKLSTDDEPQVYFSIASVDSFKDDMREFQKESPEIKGSLANLERSKSDTNWFSPILQTLLPILIFIGIWILLMRKMGGGAASGGNPEPHYLIKALK
jgi:cell division protease FtsH